MSDMPEFMSLAEVLTAIGWTEPKYRSAMNRYLEIDAVAAQLGATGAGRATKYRSTHLWLFREIARAHTAGDVAPKTAEMFLRERIAAGPAIDGDWTFEGDADGNIRTPEHSDNRSGSTALTSPPLPMLMQIERIGNVFADTLIERVKASGIVPPTEDRLINREEAAQLLGLQERPHIVARRVRPVIPGQWSRLQILNYIGELRDAADRKAQERREKRSNK